MAFASGERVKVLQGVLEPLGQAMDMESWGLFVEAAEEYQKTIRKLNVAVVHENCNFSVDEKEFFARVIQGLQLKAASLQDLSSVQEPSAASKVNIGKLKTALQGLLDSSGGTRILESSLAEALPHPPRAGQLPDRIRSLVLSDDDYSSTAVGKELAGTLVQRSQLLPRHTYINITIEKIGLKDPHNYIDPFITISVKSLLGEDIEPQQDTPVTSTREPSYIVFGTPVEIQRPVEDFPQGSAIFFEFKHFKPKKSATSTRCFSFMEMDEIKPGKAILEIYKKPTDFLRKRLSLLSIKPLYLHLTLTLHKP